MTLARQLISTISALFFVALVGIQAIHLRSAQSHLQDQLDSLAQDAATSLGLSLGVLMRGGADRALAETIINPAFDRGHYASIEFVGVNNELLVRKTLRGSQQGDYPEWFAKLFPLHSPSAESFVSGGWRQLGKVRVSVHPQFAYRQLWQTATGTALYMVLIYAAGLLALRLILNGVLRPLVSIEHAANAISARNFVTISAKPSTRELARVVEAMNTLSGKVSDAIAAETARADALHRAAFADEVSGLPNRAGFTAQFLNAYGEEREAFSGAFALLEIAELGAINRELGPERCDQLLAAVGAAVAHAVQPLRGLAARWAGAQFVLTLPRQESDAVSTTLAVLQRQLALIIGEYGRRDASKVQIGAVAGELEDASLDAIVHAAQEALASAREQAEEDVVVRTLRDASLGSVGDAGRLVQEALSAGNVLLVGQRVLAMQDGATLQIELMARIPEGTGKVMAAARFMAVVSQQRLSRQLDEAVLARVLQSAQQGGTVQAIAVNLSARSLEDADFIPWLLRWVERAPSSVKVAFELSEHGIVHNESAAAGLAAALSRTAATLAIDHFGVHNNSLALVSVLKPAYVKLSGLHTPRLVTDPGTRFLVDSMVRAAKQLDVPVIAQNVENAAQLAELRKLGVAGYQGYLAGAPAPWPGG